MAITDNLISYWEFEETTYYTGLASTSATDYLDIIDNINLQFQHGASLPVTSVPGKINNGILLQRAKQHFTTIPSVVGFNLDTTDSWTISMWVKFTDLTHDNPIMSKYYAPSFSSANNKGWLVYYDNNTARIYFVIYIGQDMYTMYINTPILNNKWYHIVFWFNGPSTSAGICLNNLSDVNSNSILTSLNSYQSQDIDIDIGRVNKSSNYIYLDAVLDSMSYWDRILTTSEISQLYNNGNGLKIIDNVLSSSGFISNLNSKLLDYFPFDEISGNRTSINNTVLIQTGFVDSIAHNNGYAAKFDGTPAYLETDAALCTHLDLNTNDSFAISFWMKFNTIGRSHVILGRWSSSSFSNFNDTTNDDKWVIVYDYYARSLKIVLRGDSGLVTREIHLSTNINPNIWFFIVAMGKYYPITQRYELRLLINTTNTAANFHEEYNVLTGTNLNNLKIGNAGDIDIYLDADIDDLSFWDSNLTLNEIKYLFYQQNNNVINAGACDLYICGKLTFDDLLTLYVVGTNVPFTRLNLFTLSSVIFKTLDLSVFGRQETLSSIDNITIGHEILYYDLALFLDGTADIINSLNLYADSKTSFYDNSVDLMTVGSVDDITTYYDSLNLIAYSKNIFNILYLYAETEIIGYNNSSLNLVLSGLNPASISVSLDLITFNGLVYNSSIPLYLPGGYEGVDLVQSNNFINIDNTLNLYLHRPEFCQGLDLYLKTIDNFSQNNLDFYAFGSYYYSNIVDLSINNTHDSIFKNIPFIISGF